jgi:hypothetical protein
LLSTLLNETAEGSDTSTRTNHDDRLAGVRGELEVGVTNMDRNVDAIILVAGACKLVALTERCRVGVAVLLLL